MTDKMSSTIKQRRPASGPAETAEHTDDGSAASGSWMTWPRALALIASFAFLGAAAGYYIAQRQPGEGSVDVGFYQDMISHHEQAQAMASLELANGQNPNVVAFAKEVLLQQSYEVGLMDGELDDWGQSRQQRSGTAMKWMGMPVPVEQMPGLATEEQLDELRNATGAEADALFLQLMAEHHRGGLHMASYAAEHADESGVRQLAARMRYNQATEINEYAATAERLGLPVTIERTESAPNPTHG